MEGTDCCDGDYRARELFHYFQPANPAMLPAGEPEGDQDYQQPVSKKKSPNMVLTALAQLAAVKLQVQRAIISLIDADTLYVVAEASQSLNLGNNDLFDDSADGLWMGCSRGPVEGTLCEETVALKPSAGQKYAFFTVKDLLHHPTFCNIPCVSGAPFFRYYTGTPLRTPKGITIGTLYVIDPRPDLPFNERHKEILGNIADTVMEYLKTSRESLEARRLNRMLTGLNAFAQIGESFNFSSKIPSQNQKPSTSRSQSPPDDQAREFQFGEEYSKQSISVESLSSATSTSISDNGNSSIARSESRGSVPSMQAADSQIPPTVKNRTSMVFKQCANLIRDSLDLGPAGGVVIVAAGESPEKGFHDSSDDEKELKLARICAISADEKNTDVCYDHERSVRTSSTGAMDSTFVRRMIRQNPRGGLWYFEHENEHTWSSSNEEDANFGIGEGFSGPNPPLMSMLPQSLSSLRGKDFRRMRKYFPRATRVIFSPLWDSVRSGWFGACFCWSESKSRVFSPQVDLGGLFGFGSMLMIQHSQIEDKELSDRKSEFISTISHEMRSPLHGILASHELLEDSLEPEIAKRLLDTIGACGKTLLDTFDQILDFTKINSFQRVPTPPSFSNQSEVRTRRHDWIQRQTLHAFKDIDIVSLVEEAVESVYSSQMNFNKIHNTGTWQLKSEENDVQHNDSLSSDLDFIIDAPFRNWRYVLESGALRRIVINLVGNAIKYTQKGSIRVNLDVRYKNENPILLLTVADTGKGISKEYLRSKIFTPFSQENVISPGVGLGLCLVRDILRSIHGKITVKSQVDVGTTVRVTVPLNDSAQLKAPVGSFQKADAPQALGHDYIQTLRSQLSEMCLSFIARDLSETDFSPSLSSMKRFIVEWFEMRIADSAADADVILVEEKDIDLLGNISHYSLVMVLSHRTSMVSKAVSIQKEISNMKFIIHPCGPHQLARTLQSWLRDRNRKPALSSPDSLLASQLTEARETGESISELKDPNTFNELHENPPRVRNIQSLGNTGLREVQTGKRTEDNPIPANAKSLFQNGLHILLVEDNVINLALLKRGISRVNPTILHTATNGEKAVAAVRGMESGYQFIFMGNATPSLVSGNYRLFTLHIPYPIYIISPYHFFTHNSHPIAKFPLIANHGIPFTDLSMPIMDGFEATRVIRSIEMKRNCASPAKIVALTGLGSDEHIKEAYAAGVDLFLRKPVSLKDIMKLLSA
ncbi:CheY-like superfamily [Penicillium malachiteum]|nr:CheY-like superfamily [Penicillium malachiteum]